MIESTQNKLAKKIASCKGKKGREESGLFVAEGIRFVSEIPLQWEIECYGVSEDYAKQHDLSSLEERAQTFLFSNAVFRAISSTETPQGILALCHQKQEDWNQVFSFSNGFYLLIEEINDPGNLGTIIRTADACKVNAIFLSEGCVDLYNPKVLRSTMGSLFHVPIFSSVNLKQVIPQLKNHSVCVYATHLMGEETFYHYDFKTACAIVIGNEARGITKETASLCHHLVKIPMPGQAESLNASIAAGVFLYEVVRQRLAK